MLEGKAWVFGDNIDTDNIFPTRFGGDSTLEEIGSHAFFDFRPEFAKQVKPEDVVFAGHNFGYGSYRETAALCLRVLGIKVIVARSFSRAYYRNAVNNGISLVTIGDQEFECLEGQVLAVDEVSGLVANKSTGMSVQGVPLTGLAAEIVQAGGATNFFKPRVLHPVKS